VTNDKPGLPDPESAGTSRGDRDAAASKPDVKQSGAEKRGGADKLGGAMKPGGAEQPGAVQTLPAPPAYSPPRPYVPPPPTEPFSLWPARVWPVDREAAAPVVVLAAAVGAGFIGAGVLRLGVVGIGWILVAIAVLAAAFGSRRRWPNPFQLVAAAGTVALFGVGAFRAAGWLYFLCVVTAWAVAAIALVGGRTWTGLILGTFAPWLTQFRAFGWCGRGLLRLRNQQGGPTLARALGVGVVTLVLLLVFGALFASADAAFAELLGGLLPEWEVSDLIYRTFLFVMVTGVTLTAATLAHLPSRFDELAPGRGKALPAWEWAVPLAVLDLLFLTFVIVQLPVLTGGKEHVISTGGLTYAEYARQGFWQLLVVAALTLAVLAVAIRKVDREKRQDRTLARVLLGAFCVLALAIVASAVRRMWLYEEEFGFTRLRILVHAVELWLAVVFVLVLAAGIALRGSWLPRAVLGTGVVTLLILAYLSPDAFIADKNVERFERTGKIDVHYLSTLTADAVPGLNRLPEPKRSCALQQIELSLESDEPWYQYNRARERARAILDARPIVVSRECPGEFGR